MFKRIQIEKEHIVTTYLVTIVTREVITIEKCKFMRNFVPKGVFQWLPKCNDVFTNPQGPNENWVPSIFC